jgi:hypothetical protein
MADAPYIPDPKDFKEIKYKVDDSYERFIVVEPPAIPDDYPFDPYGQLAHAMRRDWREHCPEGKQPCALIIDTFSEATEDINRFVSTAGRGNAGVGEVYGLDIDDPWSTDSMRTSQMNDYGKSQDLSIMALKMAMRSKQYPHVIMLGHRKEIADQKMERQPNGKYQSVKKVVGYDMGIPGRKWLGNMTKFTDQYVWHTNDGVTSMDIRLHLRSDGKHQTKFRSTQNFSDAELKVPFSYEGQANVIRKVAKLTGVDMASTEHGLRLVAYGMGGTGKTMLWTSLPEETFEIGPAVYMPFDPSAVRLASVWDELRTLK